MKFEQRLKEIRIKNGLSQQKIADILGILRPQYARYELGAQAMSIEHYKTLAEFYKVSVDYLCGRTDEK